MIALGHCILDDNVEVWKGFQKRPTDCLELAGAANLGALHVANGMRWQQFIHRFRAALIPDLLEPSLGETAVCFGHWKLLIVGEAKDVTPMSMKVPRSHDQVA